MTEIDRAELRRLAEAAEEARKLHSFIVPTSLYQFQNAAPPSKVLALLDALDKAERERDRALEGVADQRQGIARKMADNDALENEVIDLTRERDALGQAAFAAIVESGEDTDGAQDWQSYFRPLKYPSWVDAVRQNVTSLVEERDEAQLDEYQQRMRAEAAEATLDRIREVVSGHPKCDVHPDGDVVTCGWKRAYGSVVAALAPVTEEGGKDGR